MAGKGNEYREKESVWMVILYYAVVLCLLASIVMMYSSWRKRRQQYSQLVQEAAVQDQSFDIQMRKIGDVEDDATLDDLK